MSLINIVKQIENYQPQADAEVSLDFPNTYSARLGVKRSAMDAIKRLKDEYRKILLESTAFIVVTGNGRDNFATLASNENFGCFSANSEDFYNDLVDRVSPPTIKPSLFGRENVRSLFSIAQNVLRERADALEIRDYPSLMFSEKYNMGINSKEEFVSLIKRAINDQVGSELVGINAVHSVVSTALDRKHTAPVTPIILNTEDEVLALDLQKTLKRLTPKVFLVVAGKAAKTTHSFTGAISVKTVNEDSVTDALNKIKNVLL